MDYKEISRLIDKITNKGITEFELERDDVKIRICKHVPVNGAMQAAQQAPADAAGAKISESAQPQSEAQDEEAADDYHKITSPMVGTFYAAPSPDGNPFVAVGDRVKKGQICCIVEAMKLMNEIPIDVDGVIAVIHVENAQPVEYGEMLFSIDTSR